MDTPVYKVKRKRGEWVMEQVKTLATDYEARIRPYLAKAGQLGHMPPLKRHKSQITEPPVPPVKYFTKRRKSRTVPMSPRKPLHERQYFRKELNDLPKPTGTRRGFDPEIRSGHGT